MERTFLDFTPKEGKPQVVDLEYNPVDDNGYYDRLNGMRKAVAKFFDVQENEVKAELACDDQYVDFELPARCTVEDVNAEIGA